MTKKNIKDYIEEGIHGPKEINPEERRKYLGTFRERIVIALTAPQVRVQEVQPEVVEEFKSNRKAKLFLNGNIDYSTISKYMKVANQYGIPYTIVNNKQYNSEFGLVLAYDYAIDKENIFLHEQENTNMPSEKEIPIQLNKKSPISFLKSWFKK